MSVIRSADGRRPGLGVALAVIATAQLMVVLAVRDGRAGTGPVPQRCVTGVSAETPDAIA